MCENGAGRGSAKQRVDYTSGIHSLSASLVAGRGRRGVGVEQAALNHIGKPLVVEVHATSNNDDYSRGRVRSPH